MPIVLRVESFMKAPIVSVDKQTTIRDTVKRMAEHNFGSMPIKSGDEYVGIVTERDILKKCCDTNVCDSPISSIMSSPLITVESNEAIGKALELMTMKEVRRLLVTKNGKIAGIITEKDVMRETFNVLYALKITT
jgi:predicted transcriptional regulator